MQTHAVEVSIGKKKCTSAVLCMDTEYGFLIEKR